MKGRGIFLGEMSQMSANLPQHHDQETLSILEIQKRLQVAYLEEELTDHNEMRGQAGRMAISSVLLAQILVVSRTVFHQATMVARTKMKGGKVETIDQVHLQISSWSVLLNPTILLPPFLGLVRATTQILPTTVIDQLPGLVATVKMQSNVLHDLTIFFERKNAHSYHNFEFLRESSSSSWAS